MPRTPRIAFVAGLIASLHAITLAADPDYKDLSLPFDKRVADLIKHMTLEEKAEQLQGMVAANERLGIPALQWYTEASHGVARAGNATAFPTPIGMAASWDPQLMLRVGEAVANEARAKFDPAGSRYRGLIFLSPMANLARDPRWGRTQETYGEDPCLASKMAVSFIGGAQGNDPKYLRVAATPKHFAMYGQETDRSSKSFNASERDLREYYLAPFSACLSVNGAPAIATAYNGINNVPCAVNPWLLKDVLRDDWRFQGAVVGEESVAFLRNDFHFTDSYEKVIAAMLNAGVDVVADTHTWTPEILNAVKSGLIKEEQLDRALTHSLLIRFRLGMFDPPGKVPFSRVSPSEVHSQEHIDLALKLARESVVLLKNDPLPDGNGNRRILPLEWRQVPSILLIGPNVSRTNFGTYSAAPAPPISTLARSIQETFGDRANVKIANSLFLSDDVMKLAASSDVVIAAVGLNEDSESTPADREDLELPLGQKAMLTRLRAANPATIVVLFGSSGSSLPWLKENFNAILMAWYPGEQGGNAITDVLLGKHNPSGRLPLTFYNSEKDLPPLDDYELSKGRTYMYAPAEKVAYPFGHGLSYSTFEYKDFKVFRPAPLASPPDTVVVTLNIANIGPYSGDEVVQLYVARPQSNITPRPIKQLKTFQRVHVAPGETKYLLLSFPLSELAAWNATTHKFQVEPGPYELQIGASSQDIRLRSTININP